VAAEEERVLERGQAESDKGVSPESCRHGSDGPGPVRMVHTVRFDDIFLCTSDDCCDGQEEGTEEETFTLMGNGRFEGAGVLSEAEDQGHGNTSEQEKVEDVEDGTNGLETREGMRLDGNKRSKTTSSHGKSVVGPGVVLQSLTKGEVRLVGILASGYLGVLVPFPMSTVLELLEIDCIHVRRGWSWVLEWVFCLSLWLFYINRVPIGVHRGRDVGIVGCIKGCGCLDPCVGATCLTRRKESLVLLRGRGRRR
jgi:hypothetical protein